MKSSVHAMMGLVVAISLIKGQHKKCYTPGTTSLTSLRMQPSMIEGVTVVNDWVDPLHLIICPCNLKL